MTDAIEQEAIELHRHQCEVRYVAAMATRQQRAAYLDGLERWRTPEAIGRLRDDVMRAWLALRWPRSPEDSRQRDASPSSDDTSQPLQPSHAGEGSF